MLMKKIVLLFIFSLSIIISHAQLNWKLIDSFQTKLPSGLQLFYTNDSIDGKPNIAYYLEADLKYHFQQKINPTGILQKKQ
jgi:hypothetical protein